MRATTPPISTLASRTASRSRVSTPPPAADVRCGTPRDQLEPGRNVITAARSCASALSPPTALPQLTTTRGQWACGPVETGARVESPNVSPGQIAEFPYARETLTRSDNQPALMEKGRTYSA